MDYDYASCSYDELLDVQRRINREKYPENYAKIVAEIERRELLPAGERDGNRKRDADARRPLFSKNAKQKISGCALLLFALFLFFNGFVEPIWFTFKSVNWPTVPCIIFYERSSNKAGEIRYRYAIDGQTYVGERLSSSGTSGQQRSWRREYPRRQIHVLPRQSQQPRLSRR